MALNSGQPWVQSSCPFSAFPLLLMVLLPQASSAATPGALLAAAYPCFLPPSSSLHLFPVLPSPPSGIQGLHCLLLCCCSVSVQKNRLGAGGKGGVVPEKRFSSSTFAVVPRIKGKLGQRRFEAISRQALPHIHSVTVILLSQVTLSLR